MSDSLQDIVDLYLSRRTWLRMVALASASSGLGCNGRPHISVPGAPPELPQPVLGFAAVAKSLADELTVPDGYVWNVVHALGDPLRSDMAPWSGDGSETPESYQNRIGDCHDGMNFFGLRNGAHAPLESERGLLCVNHEYVAAPFVLHPLGRTAGSRRPAEEVVKEILAHGVSVAEVERDAGGAFRLVTDSLFNRRITSATPMVFSGPAAGSSLLRTLYSPNGIATRGTNNNCSSGPTPWGTYLTCEENFDAVISRRSGDDEHRTEQEIARLERYGLRDGTASRYGWNTPGSDDEFARFDSSVTGADSTIDYRNSFNTFGWVVEIDPFAPESVPTKRTALGRFRHEGATIETPVPGERVVVYMGDDSKSEYFYRFVSDARWDAQDANGGLAAGRKYLDAGTLYVAQFSVDGTGRWLPLVHGQRGLTDFADQSDVLVHARLAADAVNATPMDRPEWAAVSPTTREVYLTLTNHSGRTVHGSGGSEVNAANPRSYVYEARHADGSVSRHQGNPNGHILRLHPTAADAFSWDIYLFGSPSELGPSVNLSGLTASNDFSSPDGLRFDSEGFLWIQTDDSALTHASNCMMLVGLPGTVGDGEDVLTSARVSTHVGARATDSSLRRFLVGPRSCELTGITFTPDMKTVFVNIQHPGEGDADFVQSAFASHWPGSQTNGQANARPRSATVAIRRADGGKVARS